MHLHLYLARYTNVHLSAFDDAVSMIAGAAKELGLSCSQGYSEGPGTNIVIGSNVMAEIGRSPPPGAILYTFEQHASGSHWATPSQIKYLKGSSLWSYDPVVTRRLAGYGLYPRNVPVRYCAAWETMPKAEEDIDVAFFGSPSEYRTTILRQMRGYGLNVYSEKAYGQQRDAIYARAKVCLSLASHHTPVLQTLRIGYLLANRRCVVSDPFQSPELYPEASSLEVVDPSQVADRCRELVANPKARATIAERAYAAYSTSPFRDVLAAALRPPEKCVSPEEVAFASSVQGTREIVVQTQNNKIPLSVLVFLHAQPFWKIVAQSGDTLTLRKFP